MGLCTSKAQRAAHDAATQDAKTHDAKTHDAPPVYEDDPPEPNMQDLVSAEVDNQRREMWASRMLFQDLYPKTPHVCVSSLYRVEIAAWNVLRKLHPVEPPPAAVFTATVQQMALALSLAAGNV
jgi:hypothetical protein